MHTHNLNDKEWGRFNNLVHERTRQMAPAMLASTNVNYIANTLQHTITESIRDIADSRNNKKEHPHNHWYSNHIGQLCKERRKTTTKIRNDPNAPEWLRNKKKKSGPQNPHRSQTSQEELLGPTM